jgi:DNA polymerase-3 subunit gamma/tau
MRAGGRPSAPDDGVPLPPEPPDEAEPPDEYGPPDDEAAMLAEIDSGDGGGQATAVSDPEAAAIALLTTQLGARTIKR